MVACIKTALYAQLVQKFQKTGSIMGHELAHNPTVQIYPTHPINGPLSYFEPYQSPLQVLQKYELCPLPIPGWSHVGFATNWRFFVANCPLALMQHCIGAFWGNIALGGKRKIWIWKRKARIYPLVDHAAGFQDLAGGESKVPVLDRKSAFTVDDIV